MNIVPFATARLPAAYRQWNQLLARELFPRGRAGVSVYLAVHDGLLNDFGARAGCGNRDDFVRAVLGLTTTPTSLFTVLDQYAELWSENGQGGEPPIIAGLAFAVLAASEMATDEKATQANYYYRLSALMGVENRGKPEKFECTPDLWRLLRGWLRLERRGELIVHGLDNQHRYVDPVQSQCLVRSCDLDDLLPLLRVANPATGQFIEPEDVVPALRAWLSHGGARSRLARLLGRDPDDTSLRQAAEALCDVVEDHSIEQPSISDDTRSVDCQRASLALRLNPYPNLAWKRAKWLLRIPADSDAEELECLALVGERPVVGKLDMREPPCYDTEISGDDVARLMRGEVTITDENGGDVTPPARSLAWFQDESLKGRPGSWPLIGVPTAGIEHAVVSIAADGLSNLASALERPATLLHSDHWPGPRLHAAYAVVPRAGAALPGNITASSRARSLRLHGGLRIRRGVYLHGGLPRPEAPEGAIIRVQREGETEVTAEVTADAFASLNLPEGRYALDCGGAAAEIFILEPRWRECTVPQSDPVLDHAVRLALCDARMRGAVLDIQGRRYATYFRPGTRYRLYAPMVVKGVAPPDAGIHEYGSAHPIGHATIMGRTAAASALQRAACFGEAGAPRGPSSELERHGINRLLEYVSARSSGPVDSVREYSAAALGDGAWHRPLSTLEDLGHVDVLWEGRRSWVVAPPTALPRMGETGLSFIVGARSRQTLDWLSRRGIEAFVDPRCGDPDRDAMPDCIVARTEGLLRASDALKDVGLRVLTEPPSRQIALQTRSIVERGWWTGAEFAPPVARIQQTLRQWDTRELRWVETTDIAVQGLYRWRERGRLVHYLATGSTGASVLDPAAAKWFLSPRDRGHLVFEPATRRLLVPSAMELPRIWKRICATASGLAPLRTGRVLIYENIDLDLARAAAVRLNQPRTEGIL